MTVIMRIPNVIIEIFSFVESNCVILMLASISQEKNRISLLGRNPLRNAFGSSAMVSPTGLNFFSCSSWKCGRMSAAWNLRLSFRPLYPNMLSSPPNIAYVNLGRKVWIAFAAPADGVTREIWKASVVLEDPRNSC